VADLDVAPSAWWWNPDVDAVTLGQMLNNNKARLISLSVRRASPQRLAAVWIENSGANAQAWWWNPNVDAATLGQMLKNNKGRLIALEPFVVGSSVRFAAVWVDNTDKHGQAWWWNPDVDPATLGEMLKTNKGRLVSLKSYVLGARRRYAAVWVDNTGNNGKAWWWNPNVDQATLSQMLLNNHGRIVTLDPFIENGLLRFAAAWVANEGASARTWWWYHGIDAATLGHKFDLFCAYPIDLQCYAVNGSIHLGVVMNQYPQPSLEGQKLITVSATSALTSQSHDVAPTQVQSLKVTLKNATGSPVTVTRAKVYITESGGFVDTTKDLFPTPRQYAAGAETDDSKSWGWGNGPANMIVAVDAQNGSAKEHTHFVAPIIKTGSQSPPKLTVPPQVFVGLWADPAEIVPLWLNGKATSWISVAGHIVNDSGSSVRLAGWHLTLDVDGKHVLDKELPPSFWTFDTDNTRHTVNVAADGAAELSELLNFFVYGFEMTTPSQASAKATLTLVANFKIGGICGGFTSAVPAGRVQPVTIAPPLQSAGTGLTWNFGNGPNHDGYDAHDWPQERFAYDIVCHDSSYNSFKSSDPSKLETNDNFYAYGKPVVAVQGGTVLESHDTEAENDGYKANPDTAKGKGNNYVLLDHGNGSYSGYYHLQKGGNKVKPCDVVKAGDVLGKLGNAGGSSEPHLHFGYTVTDATGRVMIAPTIFTGLRDNGGTTVTAVPADGEYTI